MSKAFEMAVIEHLGPEALAHGTMSIYQAAEIMWNAALEHAAEVCDAAAFSSPEPMRYMECAEAICKEKTE